MNDMGSGFFGVTWLVIFGIVIIAVIWIVRNDKKKINQNIESVKGKLKRGEITEEEYNVLIKEIREQ